jgi:hypothetical protein
MTMRDGTTPAFGRRRVVAFAAIWIVACGSIRLAAQSPAVLPPADTTGSARAQAAPDTSHVTSLARGDSVNGYRRMTPGEFAYRVLGPRALLREAAAAGLDQATKRPKEWPKTWSGYGHRALSRLGTEAIAQSVVFGVSQSLDERPEHFALCKCIGAWPRLGHALLHPLRMDTPRGPHVSVLAPASEIGSAILITSLHPAGLSVRDGLVSGAVGVLVSSLGSVAREFWPWHRRPFGV